MNFKYFKTDKLITLIVILTFVCGSISAILNNCIQQINDPFKSILLVSDKFSIVGLIWVFLYQLNVRLWKLEYFKFLIDIPNMNGRYEGKLVSSYLENGNPKEMDCVLEINQTASEIHISGYFGSFSSSSVSSSSFSVSEEIIKENNGFFKLFYHFANKTGGVPEKLNDHNGTAEFYYYPDTKTLRGTYYNKLKNTGVIEVVFKSEDRLGRLIP